MRGRGRAWALGVAGPLALVLAALGAPGPAHAALAAAPAATLWQRTVDADVIALARVVHPAWEIPVGEPPVVWPVVEAEAVEILKGDAALGRLTFARDGVESPAYAAGQEVVVFLRAIARSPKLADSAVTGAVRWASQPAPVETLVLTPRDRDLYLTALRGYAAIAVMERSPLQLERLRALTLELMASSEPALARSAIADVTRAGHVPLLTRAESTRAGKLVFDPALPVETRVALLTELERRALIFGPTSWGRLLRESHGADRVVVVQAVEGNQSVGVTNELVPLLRGPDPVLAAAAATSLGSLGNHRAVEPLTRALGRRDRRVRLAIVRALGAIRTQIARQALDLAAERHPDPGTRAAAVAEALALARRHGTALAPMLPPGAGARAETAPSRLAARASRAAER